MAYSYEAILSTPVVLNKGLSYESLRDWGPFYWSCITGMLRGTVRSWAIELG